MITKKWWSIQSILVIIIIIMIFTYIGIDLVKTKPAMQKDLVEIKSEYKNLSKYLTSKLPEIDSALHSHSDQIYKQGVIIKSLNIRFKNLSEKEPQ